VAGDRFGEASPWVTVRNGAPVASVGDQMVVVVAENAVVEEVGDGRIAGSAEVAAGGEAIVALVATDREPVYVPDARDISARIDRTIASWRRWSALVETGGPWQDAVRRSALVLKTLIAEDTGAIAAGGTTSLPERMGGEKNWDYRFAWVRDSSFTLDALISLGLHEEVHRCVSWLVDAVDRNGPDLHVFYTLGGDPAHKEAELDIPGYRHSSPVRAGNSAAGQTQLGTYGDLFDTVRRYCAEGHVLDPNTGRLLARLADRCCDRWRSRDSGIWELPDLEHYTISKIGCWVALDRAARLAEEGQLPSANAERWRVEAEVVREWVHRHCWSHEKSSYTFYAGTTDLDAAVLLAGRTGFDRGERLASSAAAVAAELGRGPFVYRYTGMEAEEGAFVACTFWLVEALAYCGHLEDARRLMEEAVGLVNDVGLLAEEIDPHTGAFLGNLPQGLSHLALINAASTLGKLLGDTDGT